MTLEEKARESSINACLTNKFISQPSYEQGYFAGAKENGVVWHDLRKDPNDLPKESVIEGLSERVVGTVKIAKNQYMSQECRYDFVDKVWITYEDPYVAYIIAWCEIPQFKE